MSASRSLLNLGAPEIRPAELLRVRAITVADAGGEAHLIAPESRLVNPDALGRVLGRSFVVTSVDPRAPVAAVPGLYDMPVYLDPAVLAPARVALATERIGEYVPAQSADLAASVPGAQQLSFTEPLPAEDPSDERHRIERSLSEFTELTLQRRLDETLHIPPLPEAARQIIALRAEGDFDLADLIRIVEHDASLANRLVGWANSAYYGLTTPVRSVEDAVVRVLGLDLVMNLALGISMSRTLSVPDTSVRGLSSYWHGAVFAAATMEGLARAMPPDKRTSTGTAYLAGLTSNFGTLVMAHVFPPHFEKICRLEQANRHLPHTAADEHVVGLPREALTAALLESWSVPQEVCDAVRFQYAPDYRGDNATHVYLLKLTHQLLARHGVGDFPIQDPELTGVADLDLDGQAVARVMDVIAESANELDDLAGSLAGQTLAAS